MAAQKPKPRARALPAPVSQGEHHSVDVRKIANGFVTRHTYSTDRGDFKQTEVYSPTKPAIQMPAIPPAVRPAPRRRK